MLNFRKEYFYFKKINTKWKKNGSLIDFMKTLMVNFINFFINSATWSVFKAI